MTDIEIGISINAKLYLHIVGNDVPTAFEVAKIINIKEENGSTVLSYLQPTNEVVNIIVDEKNEDIQEAMNNAVYYKDEALKRINELLDE